MGDGGQPTRQQVALEVPLRTPQEFGAAPLVRVTDAGGFGSLPFGQTAGPAAGASRAGQHARASSTLAWQLDGDAPALLRLHAFSLGADDEQARSSLAQLQFAAPLLPDVSCLEVAQGTQLAALTADGLLHVVNVAADLQRQPLGRALSARGAVQSMPLATHFQRLGTPTCLLQIPDWVCVGTEQGHILCVSSKPADAGASVELKAGGSGLSLGKMLTGMFGRAGSPSICQLETLTYQDKEFLCAIHDDSHFRVWDVQARRLVYSGQLLPQEVSPQWRPTIMRTSVEPLDPSTIVLLAYFVPREGDGAGELHTFEIFMDYRGEATYKVHMELGPRLQGSIHRLRDMVLERGGAHSVGAWMLYDDSRGQTHLSCVPIGFTDGPARSVTEVRLLEDQLMEGWGGGEEEYVQAAVWEAVQHNLAAAGASTPGHVLEAAFLDLLLAPGRVSREALLLALAELGCVADEEVLYVDLTILRELVPAWLAPLERESSLAKWQALLRSYSAAWRRLYTPVALAALPTEKGGKGLLLLRSNCAVSLLRSALEPELAIHGLLPAEQRIDRSINPSAVSGVLEATKLVMRAGGGAVTSRLLMACIQAGLDPHGVVIPAYIQAIFAGQASGIDSSGSRRSAQAWVDWRAQCRRLPLELAPLCDVSNGFVAAVTTVLEILAAEHAGAAGLSAVGNAPLPGALRHTALAIAAQVAEAQLQMLLQLQVLLQYVLWSRSLGEWSPSLEETQQVSSILSRVEGMLLTAAVTRWSMVTPLPSNEISTMDTAQLSMALRIGGCAPKGSKLSAPADNYVAGLLFSELVPSSTRVGDLGELQLLAARFVYTLLSIQDGSPTPSQVVTTPTALAVGLARLLFRDRHVLPMSALLGMVHGYDDIRLLFFLACSKARSIAAALAEEADRLMLESSGLFFRVATVFENVDTAWEQVQLIRDCVREMQQDLSQSARDEGPQAAELQYYETLMLLYERLGCHSTASRFALAAAEQVNLALPDSDVETRLQREGRLWANVFIHSLEAGNYMEAYTALLSNQVSEVQLDCVHQLVNVLCSRGEVALLCRLPFAHTMLLARNGKPVWVPMLDEVVAALQRRADNLELSSTPQPYKVLFDLHVCRNNYQAAAAAMLTYARRLLREGAADAGMLLEAEQALGTAVSALSMVEPHEAWLEDPMPADRVPAQGFLGGDAMEDDGGNETQAVQVLTLADLQREYAIARAHVIVGASMPSVEATSTDPDDVFQHLLTLGRHDAAFDLADAVYCGTRLTRALEKIFAAMAAHAVHLQLHCTAPGGDGAGGILLGARAGQGNDGHDTFIPAAASAAAWEKLKKNLQRFDDSKQQQTLLMTAIEAALAVDPRINLPLWLTAPFKATARHGGTADIPGLLRVYLRHGRLSEAAVLAEECLSKDTVPTLAMQRTSQVYYPHALLQELLRRLQQQSDGGLQRLAQRLEQLLEQETAAAVRQTAVISGIYAQ